MDILSSLFSASGQLLYSGFLIILALVAGVIAFTKGRSIIFWPIVSFLVPWAVFILLLLPPKRKPIRSNLQYKDEFKDKDLRVASVMALSAIIAKADGHISKDEIRVIRQFLIQNYGMTSQEMNNYSEVFEYGKNHPEDIEEFIKILAYAYPYRDRILAISYLFVLIAYQDQQFSNEEDQLIQHIVIGLGLSTIEYENIKNYIFNRANSSNNYYQKAYNGHSYQEEAYNRAYKQAKATPFSISKDQEIAQHTKTLGLEASADMNIIKKAYRKLAKEYHPDKVMSEGMPKEYMDYASQRFREITTAYDRLKELKA